MDLLNGVSIRIGGELTKQNTLPISALVKLANNFQDLVNEVVKSGIADETTIKMEYFQIGLSGFKVGSAVPEFRFIRQDQVVFGADIPAQQEKVSNRLAKIISISSSGDFRELKQEFKNAESCNGIIRSLHGLEIHRY